jgi:hypothetical protein
MKRDAVLILGVSLVWGTLCLVSMLLSTGGALSMPLDDAYIFFQYAKMTASGHPLHYQAGGGVSVGATSLLTVWVDAIGYLCGFRGAFMSVFALLLGTGGLAAAGFASHRLGRRLCPRAAWVPPALVLASGPVIWGAMSGMDLPLFLALVLCTAAAWPEPGAPPPRSLFVWGALLGLCRPDAVFLIAPAFLFGLRFPSRRAWWALPLAGAALPFLIQTLATGSPQSTSMDVKSVLAAPGFTFAHWLGSGLSYLQLTIKGALGGGFVGDAGGFASNDGSAMGFYLPSFSLFLFLLGLAPGAWDEGRRRAPGLHLLLLAWTALLLLAVAFTVPRTWHWHRYLIPVFTLVLLGAAAGAVRAGALIETAWTRLRKGDGARVAGTLVVVLSLPGAAYFVTAYGRNCADIRFQHIELAEKLRTGNPVHPRILGTHDAGALAYFGDYPLLDIEGLVSPAFRRAARLGAAGIWETLERLPPGDRPDALALYPSWYDPAFLAPHRLVLAQRLFHQTIAGGNPLNVYLANWSPAGAGDRPRDPALRDLLGDRTLMADVDVADLESEDAASYRYHILDGAYDSRIEAADAADGLPVIEGGRIVSGWESFTVRGVRPGDSLLLVARSTSAFRVRVEVDGAPAGSWVQETASPGAWQEIVYRIPETLVQRETIRVKLISDDPHHSAYPAYHYWVYRR